ncbi:MAG TPA: RtcB family protein [Leifsonia sp.]|jgi:tRNA-splicing ligase RtcB|nr:RNA-splicing ligase RtcB [Microbacteriaceae bacterium]HEV7812450.1 RtcB family protein [Leifsonia sp.]
MERITDRLLSWASILEPGTLEQARAASTMPFIYPHLALMPDAHLGLGATVGSVIPTLEAIMPAAVGVDIGCGMIAVKTQWNREDVAGAGSLTTLRERIERAIPLSAGGNNRKVAATAEPRIAELTERADAIGLSPGAYVSKWELQLGTLGSGNHFIEVSLDESHAVWLFLHSGSRGVGNRIAGHHIKVAKRLTEAARIPLPDRDLAYLEEGTHEFDRYIADLRWAQHFALLNREEMMDRVIRQVSGFFGEPLVEGERINTHHNFTEHEEHFGKEVWLSRKGAISAKLGEPGLIPGSMGTASYVVTGKGDKFALESSPHGAGRTHSRSAARKKFTREQLREAMRGIEYRDSAAFLDEIPQAYKDIDQVMADAADLVSVRHTLRQILNVKGD